VTHNRRAGISFNARRPLAPLPTGVRGKSTEGIWRHVANYLMHPVGSVVLIAPLRHVGPAARRTGEAFSVAFMPRLETILAEFL
jgi:hypothetical protein